MSLERFKMKTLADKLGEQEEEKEKELNKLISKKKKVEPLKVKKTDKVYGKKK